ncbi:MAG: YraN family protein [Rhodospirillaceae bacterium]|nr:YraN family protein [Rhodospirillaceae bacterium]
MTGRDRIQTRRVGSSVPGRRDNRGRSFDAADEQRRKRQHSQGRGQRGEWLAAWFLRLKGYRILARDLRCPVGEIDLVAKRGRTLAIVEVKARPDRTLAAESISPRQRQRILAALGWFLARHPERAQDRIRFDVVLVVPGRLPLHLEDC